MNTVPIRSFAIMTIVVTLMQLALVSLDNRSGGFFHTTLPFGWIIVALGWMILFACLVFAPRRDRRPGQ